MRVCLYSHQMQISTNTILAVGQWLGTNTFAPLREHRTIRVREVDPRQSSNKTQSDFNLPVSAYLHLYITTKTTLSTIMGICGNKPSREEAWLWMAYVR